MSLEPKPPAKRKPSPQTKLVLTATARKYIEAVSRRTEIPQRLVVDRLVREAQELERACRALGYKHVGEILAVFREMKGAR